jgi:hypothetical protein
MEKIISTFDYLEKVGINHRPSISNFCNKLVFSSMVKNGEKIKPYDLYALSLQNQSTL